MPLQQLRQPSITSHPPSAARLAGCLLGRAGSLPQGVAHSVCRRRAGCLPGAVASQHAHPPGPLGRSCLLLPWPAPGPPCPTGWTPSETPHLSVLSACQPLPPYSAPPGPACRSFLCPGLSFTVFVHAFVPIHKPGSSTLFGLAVRFPPGFFFGGGCGRKLTCPSMPIISAIRKTDKANHRRVSGPQHIL